MKPLNSLILYTMCYNLLFPSSLPFMGAPTPASLLAWAVGLEGHGLCCQMGHEEPPAALGPSTASQPLLPWRGPLPCCGGGPPSCTSLVPGPLWHPACELGRLGAFRAPHHRAPSAGPARGDPGLSQSLEALNNLSQSLDLNRPPLPAPDAFAQTHACPFTCLVTLLTGGEGF